IERLCFLAPALASSFETGAVHDDGGFEALIALFDSTITFHAQYQQSREVPALLDLLVLDRDNPRSLSWVAQTLRGRLAKLAGSPQGELDALALMAPDPERWALEPLCQTAEDGTRPRLAELLAQCNEAAWRISDEISLRYFTHTGESGQSLGA
ncbi:MAG: alpha-E domain-containing protein, partial [Hylemonella sp.]